MLSSQQEKNKFPINGCFSIFFLLLFFSLFFFFAYAVESIQMDQFTCVTFCYGTWSVSTWLRRRLHAAVWAALRFWPSVKCSHSRSAAGASCNHNRPLLGRRKNCTIFRQLTTTAAFIFLLILRRSIINRFSNISQWIENEKCVLSLLPSRVPLPL